METYSTFDYSRFKFIDTNRKVGSVKRLKRSIETTDLTRYNPIKVTPNFEILDGQNRFVACKELGKPIYYTIVDMEVDVNTAITAFNTAQKNWQLVDYLEKYCKLARPNYLAYRNFMRYHNIDNGHLGVMTTVFCGVEQSSQKFKEGNLGDKWEEADRVMGLINTMNVPYRHSKNFIRAFVSIYKTRNEKEIKKLRERIVAIPNLGTTSDFIAAMNNKIDSRR